MEKIEDMEIRNNHKSQKTVKTASAIFSESLKSLKSLMQIFVESAKSAKSARSIYATSASANFVGKASCESTMRYGVRSRIPSCLFRYSLDPILSRFSLASLICLCMLTVGVEDAWGAVNNGDLFERISSAPSANDEVIIVNSGGKVVLGGQNGNFRDDEAITTSSNQYIYKSTDKAQVLTIKVVSGYYGFYTGSGFLQQPSNNNYLTTNSATFSATLEDAQKWSLTAGTTFTITSKRNTDYMLQYNASSTRFATYKASSKQANPSIYKKVMSAPTEVAASSVTTNSATITITDATNVNNYEVYYSTNSTAPTASSTATTTITSGKSKSITGLTAGTNYYVWARAYSTSPARKTGWVALTGNYFTTSSASCGVNPTAGSASLNGSISLSSFPVQTTGWTVGANCAWSDFGFVWSSSVSTPTLESNGTASSGCTKIQKATDGTSTSTSHSITGTFNTSTSYYVRGYGKNGYASGTYQYTDVLTITPRSVEFNSNGGSAVDTKYVNSGTKVTAPSDPTKTGYNFGEWQLNSSEFDFANTNVTSNITLVATWTAKTTTVSFNQNSGTGGQTGTLTATYDQAMPTPITTPTRVGYNFGGYYDGSGGTGNQYYTETGASARTWNKEGSTATLYAKWTVKNYSVTWMVNGSEWSGKGGSTNVNHGSHVSTLPTAPNPAEDACGDKFVGWTTVEEYTHGTSPLFTTADGAPTVTVEGDVTYYAVFADYDE